MPGTYSHYTHQAQLGPVSFSAGFWDVDLDASVHLHPETFNPRAQGEWVTAYISLPDCYDIEDIEILTVILTDGLSNIPADWGNPEDHTDYGYVLMVKFSRAAVADMLAGLEGEVELTVTGDGVGFSFSGTDTIMVLAPPVPSFTTDSLSNNPESTAGITGEDIPPPPEVTDPEEDPQDPHTPVDAIIPQEEDDLPEDTGEDTTADLPAEDPETTD
jgi:hypothetical protein